MPDYTYTDVDDPIISAEQACCDSPSYVNDIPDVHNSGILKIYSNKV